MDLTGLTVDQIMKLRAIATQMNITLEELMDSHKDVNTLLESHKDNEFGMLNEYEQTQEQILND